MPRLRSARVRALVLLLWSLLAVLRGQGQEQGDGQMTPAQDMATRQITNTLTYIAKIDYEIRWHREHPGKTAAARHGSKQCLAMLTERRTKLVEMVRRIEARNGLENWSELE